jgi:glycosyltransferase involved in cell wall biosynthesis
MSGDRPVSGGPATRRYRLAYLVTHPIQYQAPLLRLIASEPDLDLTVFFQSEGAVREHHDSGFGQLVRWDVPLLDGYRYEVLPALGRRDVITAQRPFSYGLARRMRRARFDALWVHGYARLCNWQAMLVAKALGIKVLLRDEANAGSAPRSAPRRLAKRGFFRLLAGVADAFLAIGSRNRDYYLANGIAGERIFMMPYSVDNDFFARLAQAAAPARERLRVELGLSPDRAVILYASKFQRRKRPDELLLAYQRLCRQLLPAPPYLLFLGDGEMRAALQAQARAQALADVRFLGFRNQTELPAFFDLADVFVLPSIHEPWGLIVNEVMAVGRAVVVSDQVGCAADLVRHGVNGYIFPAGDVDALAASLREIVTAPERARAMGAASRAIIERWSLREAVAGLRQALRAVLA